MKLASVTVTFNDDHLISKWQEYFEIYKHEIDLHIIVDNASDEGYFKTLQETFPSSVIIRRETNGGVTAGFNDGMRKALDDPDVAFILLACPDIRYEAGAISILKDAIEKNERIGIAGPLLLEKEGKKGVLGARLSKSLQPRFHVCDRNSLDNFSELFEVDFISGGINLISRNAIEQTGYQDESLFMYGDEVDYDLRIRNHGFSIVAVKDSIAWHMHVNRSNARLRGPESYFLISRNSILLIYKHLKRWKRWTGMLASLKDHIQESLSMLMIGHFRHAFAIIRGLLYGFLFIHEVPGRKH